MCARGSDELGAVELLGRGVGGRREAPANGGDHLEEPVEVEEVEDAVAGEVGDAEPGGDGGGGRGEAEDVGEGFGAVGGGGGEVGEGRVRAEGGVDVGEDLVGLVGAVDEAGGEEGEEEGEAVVELELGPGEAELVAEPVDVEEGGGELPEDEDGGVVVDEGSLQHAKRDGLARVWQREGEQRRTKPKE